MEDCNKPTVHNHNPRLVRTPVSLTMAALVAPGHVPPAPIKEQVVDHLPKRFKEMKFGIQLVQPLTYTRSWPSLR